MIPLSDRLVRAPPLSLQGHRRVNRHTQYLKTLSIKLQSALWLCGVCHTITHMARFLRIHSPVLPTTISPITL